MKKLETEMSPKEKLLFAALDLFSQKGYSATSVDEIAESIGIKGPNIYKYFKGKEGILKELTSLAGVLTIISSIPLIQSKTLGSTASDRYGLRSRTIRSVNFVRCVPSSSSEMRRSANRLRCIR